MFVRNNRTHSVEREQIIDILTGEKTFNFPTGKKKRFLNWKKIFDIPTGEKCFSY